MWKKKNFCDCFSSIRQMQSLLYIHYTCVGKLVVGVAVDLILKVEVNSNMFIRMSITSLFCCYLCVCINELTSAYLGVQ